MKSTSRKLRGPGRPASPLDRRRLLEVARRAFARSGYAGTSLGDIARQLGLSKAAILYHYPSKEVLYAAVLSSVVEDLVSLVARAGDSSHGGWRVRTHRGDGVYSQDTMGCKATGKKSEQVRVDSKESMVWNLDTLGVAITRYLASHVDAAKLLLTDVVLGGPFVRGEGKKLVLEALKATAGFLKDGMQKGAFRPSDERHLALSIASVHLLYFAMADIIGDFFGGDIRSPRLVRARCRAVLEQVRALCVGEKDLPDPRKALPSVTLPRLTRGPQSKGRPQG